MDIKRVFKHFGLDEKEAAIYLANLELGTASAQEIAKKAGIQRTYFYDLSARLINIGLMRQVKRGSKRLFAATEPKRLLEIQEEYAAEIKKVLPQLNAVYNTSGQKPAMFYYEGLRGIDQINDDSLRYEGEMVAFTTPRFLSIENQKLSREFIARRLALNKHVRVIGQLSPEMLQLKKRDKEELRETRLLPFEIFNSEVEIGIYGNRLFVINYKKLFGFIVEDGDFANAMKKIFDIVWDSGKMIG
ncbi:MAG: hypothetical protein HYS44_01460 [Candidatus Niyogibacteria bacterium]|nr:hypothetical protein [Candidatus Niyogibacteria bacterium]